MTEAAIQSAARSLYLFIAGREVENGIRHAAEIVIEGKSWAKQILHNC